MALAESRQLAIAEIYKEEQPAGHFDLYRQLAFPKEAIRLMHEAKFRVWVMSMHAELGHGTGPLLNQLKKTAKRGIDTKLNLDDYTLALTDTKLNAAIPFIKDPNYKAQREFRRDVNAVFRKELAQAGVDIRYHKAPLGLGTFVPYAGCDHRKILVIDDVILVGGMNLSDANVLSEDFMVKITDLEMVKVLAKQLDEDSSKDQTFTFKDGTKVFVDVGVGTSKVLDEDLETLKRTKESFYAVSGFPPDGRFLKALEAAIQRGVDVGVIIQPPYNRGLNPIHWIIQRTLAEIRKRKLPVFIYPGAVHAKMFVADGEIGRFGSHNFTDTTQWGRTRELSIQSRNRNLTEGLTEFYNSIRKDCYPYV